jgi:hypothetical protein
MEEWTRRGTDVLCGLDGVPSVNTLAAAEDRP